MRPIILVMLALFVVTPNAAADTFRRPRIVMGAMPEPEGVACYWKHGRSYCSRYCYREVNGRRYCEIDERQAYPQGPLPVIVYQPMIPCCAPR